MKNSKKYVFEYLEFLYKQNIDYPFFKNDISLKEVKKKAKKSHKTKQSVTKT